MPAGVSQASDGEVHLTSGGVSVEELEQNPTGGRPLHYGNSKSPQGVGRRCVRMHENAPTIVPQNIQHLEENETIICGPSLALQVCLCCFFVSQNSTETPIVASSNPSPSCCPNRTNFCLLGRRIGLSHPQGRSAGLILTHWGISAGGASFFWVSCHAELGQRWCCWRLPTGWWRSGWTHRKCVICPFPHIRSKNMNIR